MPAFTFWQLWIYLICIFLLELLLLDETTAQTSGRISEKADVSWRNRTDSLVLGDEVILKCSVDGSPPPEVKWYRNKIRLFQTDNSGYRLRDSQLKIKSLSVEHNGVYSCEADNSANAVAESGETFLLNVMGNNSAFLKGALFLKKTITVRDSNVWMDCQYENAVSTRWYKGVQTSELVTNSTRLRRVVYENGTLQILSVKRSDEGTYSCQGVGPDGVMQSFTAELRIARLGRLTGANFRPNITIGSPMILAQGTRFEIDCLRPDGIPAPTIRWLHPSSGEILLSGSEVSLSGSKLIFADVKPSMTSNYTCVAQNMAGRREITVQIVVTVRPEITDISSDTDIKEGQLGQLHCRYTGTPPPWTVVTWYLNDKPLKESLYESQALIVDHHSGTLTINRAVMSLEGVYTCAIQTQEQDLVQSRPISLNVVRGACDKVNPFVWTICGGSLSNRRLICPNYGNCLETYVNQRQPRGKLKFYPKLRSMTFELGSSESVTCTAVAETSPAVSWIRSSTSGAQLPTGVVSNSGELTFTNIQKEAAGDYTCVATHQDSTLDVINATISIIVGVSPTITYKSDNETVQVGDSIILHCEASGDPTPYVKWDKDSVILTTNSSTHIQQLDNNSLLIESVEMEDDAVYGCIVGNIRGFKRVEMWLTVLSNASDNAQEQDLTTPMYTTENPGIGMTKTIVIAVCSSVAYLALVVGLIAYCSIRLMRKKQRNKKIKNANLQLHRGANHEIPLETDGLMSTIPEDQGVIPQSNGNGNVYVMHEMPYTVRSINDTILEDCEKATPSQRSYKSNASSQSTRSNTDIVKYDRSKLHNIGVLGNGMYGDVFLGKAPGLCSAEQLVCVKRLSCREELVQIEFRREVEMFHKLSHDRICRLLALCKEAEPIYMIMEYCEWGDLKQFLLATSNPSNGQELTIEPPNTAQKLSMCHQIATAMSYLSSSRFVHKDLASRNILLEPNLSVKVASLGLSRDIYASEYVQANTGLLVPLRWTAPEAWLEDDYSTKSDIWSFGCFLYEVFSGADIPYSDKTNEQVIAGYVSGDIEPIAGDDMPTSLQTIAYQCWSSSPRDRPDFTQIVTMFSSIIIDSRV